VPTCSVVGRAWRHEKPTPRQRREPGRPPDGIRASGALTELDLAGSAIEEPTPGETPGGEVAERGHEHGRARRHRKKGSRWRQLLGTLVAVQLVGLVAVASIVAARFPVFSPIDEGAHYTYIQQIAQHGSLPVLGKTLASPQELAISQGVYPRPTTINPRTDGLGGLSYEAFQPPLYYMTAVAPFDLFHNYKTKVYAVRYYDVLLLVASALLSGLLARMVLGRRYWLFGWSAMLSVLLLPAVVVRSVTISNMALAGPMVLAFVVATWVAWRKHSSALYLVSGALAGLCVLTELELLAMLPVLLVVLVAEAWHRRPHPVSVASWSRHLLPVVAAGLVALVVIAPWIGFNEVHYHMWNAGKLAVREQMAIVNPHHLHFSLPQLPNDTVAFLSDPTLPAEWGGAFGGHPFFGYVDQLLAVAVIPLGLLVAVATLRRRLTIDSAIVALPWLLTIVVLWYVRYGEQWFITARYYYPELPVWILFVAGGVVGAARSPKTLVYLSALPVAGLALVWVNLGVRFL
jgi:hypothetical protein